MAKATIKTIAEKAGVSTATVSKALNDMPDVSVAVKMRIRDIASSQGYILNIAAKQLASGHSYTVGVILPEITRWDTAIFYSTLTQRLQRADYTVLFGNSEGDVKAEATMAVSMIGKGVEVLVVMAATSEMRHIEEAVKGNIPVIYVGGATNPNAKYSVACGDYNGGMLVGRALYHGGCRDVAVLTFGSAATVQHERSRGFIAYMQEHGASVTTYKESGLLTEETGVNLIRQLLKKQTPHGIFATDDLLAFGAMGVLWTENIRIPNDMQLVGYGNSPYSALALTRLTTIESPLNEVGICTSDMVLSLMRNEEDIIQKLTLEPRLVRRSTTK